VLGLLDDLLIVPAGIWLALRLIPPALMAEFRAEAAARAERPVSRGAAVAIGALWLAAIALAAWLLFGR
jgi:hypothetical protein